MHLLIIALAFSCSLVSVGLLRRWFLGILMDIPNERSSHTQPTPRGGGLGFIGGFAVAALVAWFVDPDLLQGVEPGLWFALLPLVGIGILDDWRDVPSGVRYLVQLGVAIAIVAFCGPFPLPGLELWGMPGAWLAVGITVIGFTALVNFYNFMDGLDGLVAGVAAVQLSFLALWGQQPVLWLWVAALGGFLCWNWAPAKIFMGDAGSTVLGALVALVLLTAPGEAAATWVAIAILLPLIGDAIYTLGRRLLKGENIFQAHRTHLYQRLHQVGWRHSAIAGLYMVLTAGMALVLWRYGLRGAGGCLVATVILLSSGEKYLVSRAEAIQPPAAIATQQNLRGVHSD